MNSVDQKQKSLEIAEKKAHDAFMDPVRGYKGDFENLLKKVRVLREAVSANKSKE
jgi:hypothetical protein